MFASAKRDRISLFAALSLWAIISVSLVRHPPGNILTWDTFGYYLYLPATFVHHDPAVHDVMWVKEVVDTYHNTGTIYQVSQLPDGRWVMKYPMGMAMLWLPFYTAGDVVARITEHARDGFSAPYQWSIICALLFYALVGLLVLRRVLLEFFSDAICAATLALVVMGTNYLHQALYSTGMPHVFLFTLYAGVLWQSIRWHQAHLRRNALLLGALIGLLVVARPSEAVCVFIPFLFGFARADGWRGLVRAWWSWRVHVLLIALAAFMFVLPQLAYWKWMTGKWLYMSYNNPGEGFEFLHPYLAQVLFSFRKGWFIYTPVMAVATAGLFLMRRYLPTLRWSLIVFVALNLYIVSSWSCWWYADSFGPRALVQSYAVMALPLGAVLMWLRDSRRWRIPGVAALLGLVALNLFQIWQSEHGMIHTSRMTWSAYKAVFGKLHAPTNFDELLSVERAYDGQNGRPDPRRYLRRRVMAEHFGMQPATDPASGVRDTVSFAGNTAFLLAPGREFTPAWRMAWEQLTGSDHVWLEVTCRVQRPLNGTLPKLTLVTTLEHGGNSYGYSTQDAALEQVAPGEWQRVQLWYLSPEVRRPEDPLILYCWLRDTLPVLVDEIEVTLYEPRQPQ